MNIDEQMFGTHKNAGVARCGDAVDAGSERRAGVRDGRAACGPPRFAVSLTIKEVTFLTLGDWQRLAQEMPPDTPVIFRYDGQQTMRNEDYCDGLRAVPSRMWEGRSGWRACILVELGERF